MENRQPTYPGRVILTPVPGTANTYDMTRADEPTAERPPLNKATWLQDTTCALLDIPNTSVPNDAFMKLALGTGNFGYSIHVQIGDGVPAPGAVISGSNISPVPGYSLTTDDSGDCIVVSPNESITVSVASPYLDFGNQNSVSIQRDPDSVLTNYTVSLQQKEETDAEVKNSGVYNLSPLVEEFDLCLVAGGGGGCYRNQNVGTNYTYGSGGGGGWITNELGLSVLTYGRKLTITVGAGGSRAASSGNGGNGGTTTVELLGKTISSPGGGGGIMSPTANGTAVGGTGNGNGGNAFPNRGQNGGNAVGYKFDDESLGVPGGGGGAGYYYGGPVYTGGTPNGGSTQANQQNGKYPGGGGAGGDHPGNPSYLAGMGAAGCVFVRWHFS